MEDNALIEKFKSGDEEGFEMLVKKYQNRVNNIIDSLLGTGRYTDDIAQEVFIKVYKNLGSFKKKAAFSTWLYRITVNTAYNYLKKEKRYVPLETELPMQPAGQKEKELQEMIKKALEKLPFKYRTVIILKDIEGLSYKDIAASLACRIGTVESRLFRARHMLKKVLRP